MTMVRKIQIVIRVVLLVVRIREEMKNLEGSRVTMKIIPIQQFIMELTIVVYSTHFIMLADTVS